jgi:Flp pilus assembly protein TadB
MKYAALFALLSFALVFALACPVMAKPHHAQHHRDHHYAAHDRHHHAAAHDRHHRDAARASHHAEHYTAHETAPVSHSGITCEMVRAYVAKVGMGQAIAMAKSAGISAAEEERARQCLAKRI